MTTTTTTVSATGPEQTADLPVIGHYVGGRTVASPGTATIPVHDPATGEPSGAVAVAGEAEVEAAIAVSAEAQQRWAEVPPHVRARALFRFRDAIERNQDRLARVITSEHGKTIEDAAGEVMRGLEVVEFACGIPHLLKGENSPQVAKGIDSFSLRQPLGVTAGITPFNFPVMVPLWMMPVSVACGNAFVLKPSEKDPSASLLLAELFSESGGPDGVFNVVQGDATATNVLLTDPRIQAVSFVGSTPVAEHVYRTATNAGKRVQALGGAKNHAIVLPDADLDYAAKALMGAAFGSAGERCMAVSVAVVVGDETADALVDRLTPLIRGLRVGPGDHEGTDMGPLVTREHWERVVSYVESGQQEGAVTVVDGREIAEEEGGYFLGGTLFDRVAAHMRIYREEIFGPVLALVRVSSLTEALDLVNDHEFGNGAVLFTSDGRAAQEFVSRVSAGMVGVNVPVPVPMAFHSFGGWKRSLFGDHHMHGTEGVRFYTRLKTAVVRWPKGTAATADFSMPVNR